MPPSKTAPGPTTPSAPKNVGKPRRRHEPTPQHHVASRFDVVPSSTQQPMHFVFAHRGGSGPHSVGRYLAKGYELVKASENGPRLRYQALGGEAELGKDIEVDGMVLMCIPMRDDDAAMDYAALVEYGEDGQSGQERLDQITALLKRGVVAKEGVDLSGQEGDEYLPVNLNITDNVEQLNG